MHTRAATLILSLATLTATLAWAPQASADLVGTVDPTAPLVIEGERVLADGEFVLTRHLVVAPGATLTIRNATVWLDAATTCSPIRGSLGYCQADLTVEGTLRIVDSTVDTHRELVHDGQFDQYWSITGFGGILHVEGSVLRHVKLITLQSPGPQPSTLVNNIVEDGKQGFVFTRGAVVHAEDNLFQRLWFGMMVWDGASTLRGNHFRDIVIRAIESQGSIVGEKPYGAAITIENNVIENVGAGIVSYNNHPNVIRGNVVRNADHGIIVQLNIGATSLSVEPPVVEGNRIENAKEAIAVRLAAMRNVAEARYTVPLRGNAFVDSCIDVVAANPIAGTELTVDARENWWGSSAGPANTAGCPAVQAPNYPQTRVTSWPWLSEDPTA